MSTDIFCFYTEKSKPVKQEVNGTGILPPLVFPGLWLILTGNAALAASTALSISAWVDFGTFVTTSLLAGSGKMSQ
jgi:hypothetical protein